jgi:murein L,D-transpeptidase YcbB/YkuD
VEKLVTCGTEARCILAGTLLLVFGGRVLAATDLMPDAGAPNRAAKVSHTAAQLAQLTSPQLTSRAVDDAAINAAIPMPEPLDLQPLTPADIGHTEPERRHETADAPAAGKAMDAAAEAASSGLQVAENLRELLARGAESLIDRKDERDAVEAFYHDRQFQALWSSDGTPSSRAKDAISYLRHVSADGLDPNDYPTPDFSMASSPADHAEADIRLTAAILRYARHARTGRVNFTRVSGAISYQLQNPDPADVLKEVAGAESVQAALDSFQPQQQGYKALKAKLAQERRKDGDNLLVLRIPDGPVLRPGSQDPRVAMLRKRLQMAGDTVSPHYDDAVADAVKAFQREEGLAPDGLIGPKTLSRLNGESSRAHVVETIIANMERWRWLPRDLGESHVMLNIPDFTLKVVDRGKTVWSTRVVVGKPGRMATPLLSDTIKYITVNPTWNVPPSIIQNEYLPALEKDPDVLERIGLKLIQNRDGTLRVYQPPGPNNALGRIRFNFPNKFLVYQHDTPDKHLFAHAKRAYSHGCMRVEHPDEYAEALLAIANPLSNYTASRIRAMYGKGERNITLDRPIPVHLTYQTAFVDDTGALQIRDDVYGRDSQMMSLMKGANREIADKPIVRPDTTNRKPVMARRPLRPDGDSRASHAAGLGGAPSGPGGFFGFFFR